MFSEESNNELMTLITAYFGQDHDLIDDSLDIERKITIYLQCSTHSSKYELIENIDDFLASSDEIDERFEVCYGFHFAPVRWGTTPRDFLLRVRERVSQALLASSEE